MFKHRVNGASGNGVNRACSAYIACPDGLPLNSESNKAKFKL